MQVNGKSSSLLQFS